MATMDDLIQEVKLEQTRLEGLQVLLQGLHDQVNSAIAAGGPQAVPVVVQSQIDEVFRAMKANVQVLDTALNANLDPNAVPADTAPADLTFQGTAKKAT